MDMDYSRANITNLAKMFGLNRTTVRSKIEKTAIQPVNQVRGVPVYLVSEVAQLIYGMSAGNRDDEILDPDTLEPSQQRDYWHAKQKKQDYLASIKAYLHQDDVRREIADLASRIKETIQSYPDRAEAESGASPKEVERLIVLCDGLQFQIYSEFLD